MLQAGDVLKVDIGIHVKGRICDSAFTMIFEPTYETLLTAVKAATNTGVKVRSASPKLPHLLIVSSIPALTRA